MAPSDLGLGDGGSILLVPKILKIPGRLMFERNARMPAAKEMLRSSRQEIFAYTQLLTRESEDIV